MEPILAKFIKHYRLTGRERDIVACLTKRRITLKEIAETLDSSPSTVNNQLNSIFQKTKTKSKGDLLGLYLDEWRQNCFTCMLSSRPSRILIIEDDEEFAENLAAELRVFGLRAFSTTSPPEAMTLIKEIQPDIVLMDINMPRKNGLNLLTEIRQNFGQYPVIFLMSGDCNQKIEKLLDFGAAGIFHKPFNLDQLYKILMRHSIISIKNKKHMFKPNSVKNIMPATVELQLSDLGSGGFFIPAKLDSNFLNLELNDYFKLNFSLSGHHNNFQALLKVIWQRKRPDSTTTDLPLGIGAEFVELSLKDRDLIFNIIRKNNIHSYIPLGRNH